MQKPGRAHRRPTPDHTRVYTALRLIANAGRAPAARAAAGDKMPQPASPDWLIAVNSLTMALSWACVGAELATSASASAMTWATVSLLPGAGWDHEAKAAPLYFSA